MAGKRKKVAWEVDERGCYICTSHARGTHGYPCVHKDGRNQNLHRVLYEEAHGSIPAGLVVRHRCDEPRCINLEHLVLGTPKQNGEDKANRGRAYRPHGELSGTAKLTWEQVRAIKAAVGTQAEIGRIYGVTQSEVSRIKNNKRWKWPDPTLTTSEG